MANRKGPESSIFNPLILYVPLPESVSFLEIIKHVIPSAKNWVRLQLKEFCVGHSLPSTWRTLVPPQPQDSTRLWLEFYPGILAQHGSTVQRAPMNLSKAPAEYMALSGALGEHDGTTRASTECHTQSRIPSQHQGTVWNNQESIAQFRVTAEQWKQLLFHEVLVT